MGNKRIRVFFNNLPKKNFNLKNYFPFAVLFKNFEVEVVKDYKQADAIFEMTLVGGKSYINEKNKIVIIVSGENIFMKRNLFNWIERFVRVLFGEKRKYNIMDKLDGVIPYDVQKIPLNYFFPEYIKLIKNIDKRKNCYAILCNKGLNNKKIYEYPLFLADFHDKMQELVKSDHKVNLKDKKFCIFAVSSNSARERVKFFKELSKYKKVDSCGKVMNNVGPIYLGHWRSNPELFSNYKFVICFENCFVDHFISEKLTNALLSKAIPIYRGPNNTKDYFNTTSFINYRDYRSYEKMITKIIELDKDDKKYKEFLKKPWFYKNKIPKDFKKMEKDLIKFYSNAFNGIKK